MRDPPGETGAARGGGGFAPLDEWLVANGVGGYAAGTVAGPPTRRYHGLLIAALPNPLGRLVMLSDVREELIAGDGSRVRPGGRLARRSAPGGGGVERSFSLEAGLPVWRYRLGRTVIEKRLVMPHGRNSVHLAYRYAAGEGRVELRLGLAMHWRRQEEPVRADPAPGYRIEWTDGRLEIRSASPFPPLRVHVSAVEVEFVVRPGYRARVEYPREAERGYPHVGSLWSPGHYSIVLEPGAEATLVASTEDWPVVLALSPAEASAAERERRRAMLERAPPPARAGVAARLVLAADAFTVTPGYRLHEVERAHAAERELRTVLAGYYWFTDWGRDTMISLEGLALRTGRFAEARQILLTFGRYVRDGLIPNMFPTGSNEGLYNTADATLWFVHAIGRYEALSGDRSLLELLYPKLVDVFAQHLAGTEYGIGADPRDGLLAQGAPGVPLTWMDAVYRGRVVTPRRGKAVEINALWYNALRLMERWAEREGPGAARRYGELAAVAAESFDRRFWDAERGYLLDVVDGEDGDDPRFRPNQLFAISLPFPVLRREHWAPVVTRVRDRLLTPFGLRSLAPGEPGFHALYHGDRRARDSAYHQGTVWPWLIGPFTDAWLRAFPGDRRSARGFLAGLLGHLDRFGVGTIGEVYDAEPPYAPGGCIAQAWSVAEVLRVLTAYDLASGEEGGPPLS